MIPLILCLSLAHATPPAGGDEGADGTDTAEPSEASAPASEDRPPVFRAIPGAGAGIPLPDPNYEERKPSDGKVAGIPELVVAGDAAQWASPDVDATIVVVADPIDQAREEAVRAAAQHGYTERFDQGGAVILRHPDRAKGEVVFHPSGLVDVRRATGPASDTVILPDGRRLSNAACTFDPACREFRNGRISARAFRNLRTEVLDDVRPAALEWRARLVDRAVESQLDDLPDRLYALFYEGVPLVDGATIPTWEARRAAIYAYWDGRTEDRWGMMARDVVAAFVRGEVQGSDHPFPAEEQARLDDARRSTAPFPWTAPVDDDLAFDEP